MPTQETTVPTQLSVPTGKTGQIEHSVNFIYKTNAQYVDFVSNSSAAELDWTADLAANLQPNMDMPNCPMESKQWNFSHALWRFCRTFFRFGGTGMGARRLQSYRSVLELPLEALKG